MEEEIASKTVRKAMASVPPEVIIEILSWLPVKSLLRFRSVCKSWLSLISNNQFIHLHLNHSIQSDKLSLFFINGPFFSTLPFPMDFITPEHPVALRFTFPFYSPHSVIKIIGSCNGLLCISTLGKSIFLLNPSTRCYAHLSDHPAPSQGHSFTRLDVGFGFGYSALTRAYKVLRFLYNHPAGLAGDSCKSEVQIHTVGTDSWRTIRDSLPCDIHRRSSGCLVNGYIHWIATSNMFVSFDVGNEEFGIFKLPEFEDDNYKETFFFELKGCLGLFRNLNKQQAEVWVMTEYGVNESWSRQFTISQPATPGSPMFFKPLRFLNNGNFLLRKSDGKLVIYDLTSESSSELTVHGLEHFFVVTDYLESIVSVNFEEPPSI